MSEVATSELATILDTSRRFYRQHNLADWAEAVRDVPVSTDDLAEISRAGKQGFTAGFVFPPFDLQIPTLDRLIDETARTPSAMWPQDITTRSTPWRRSQSSMKPMNGRSTRGTTGLGYVVVRGRRRVPSPPARISACT